MKIIAVTGAQGSGKSTLIEALRPHVPVDDFKVSRAVQARLGLKTLSSVMDSWDLMTKFQYAVLEEKSSSLLELLASPGDVTITERSSLDMLAYSRLWVLRHIQRGSVSVYDAQTWFNEYREACITHTHMYAAFILLPLMEHVVFENDPQRADEESATFVFRRIMHEAEFFTQPNHCIVARSVQDRATEALEFIKKVSHDQ